MQIVKFLLKSAFGLNIKPEVLKAVGKCLQHDEWGVPFSVVFERQQIPFHFLAPLLFSFTKLLHLLAKLSEFGLADFLLLHHSNLLVLVSDGFKEALPLNFSEVIYA